MTKFLVAILLIGWLADRAWRWLRADALTGQKTPRVETASKCPRCGAYGLGDTPCGKPDCPAGRKA